MTFDIDVTIVVLFLVVNLAIGIYAGHGKTTLREYAVGDKRFSTGTLVATIIATCIGGGFFSGAITESYKQGLYFIIPAIGEPLCLIIMGYFLIPRMAEFLGDLSIADAMGNLYGKYVRIISAISGILLCIGIVALQFKVGASILGIFFKISGFYATLLCAIIVTIYSAYGGVKAVTFTDIIQFFTFGTIIPIISLSIWGTLNDPHKVFSTLTQNPLFDYTQVFDLSNARFTNTLFLLMFFLIPAFQPVFFQRIIMAKNIIQARKAFIVGGSICFILLLIISWVGVLLLSSNPNIEPNNLLPYVISSYSYAGLKGLTAAGILAVIMSTADSYINSAAVLFTNDVLKPLNIKKIKFFNELTTACIFSFIIGSIGFFAAFKAATVLKLLLFTFSFYAPIVSAPLLLTILGFRSTSVSVLIGMAAGSLTVIICNVIKINDDIIPALSIMINIVFLVSSHYLLRQPGGWVGIKNPEPINLIRAERKRKIHKFIRSIKEFNFISFCKNNSPKEEYIYSLFGLFSVISVFSTVYSMPKEIQEQNHQLIEFINHTVLVCSSIFLTYPVWPPFFKKEKFIIIAWNIAIPYVLLFSPVLLIMISNFGQFELMILLINIIITALLLRWQVVILMMVISVFAAMQSYKWFIGVEEVNVDIGSLQFKIMYLLLLVTSVFIAFLKPRQQNQEISETIKTHLYDKNKQQQLELVKLSQYKKEFIERLDKQCINVFRSIYNQIGTLDIELKSPKDKALLKKRETMINIITKLKAGAEYLDNVIFQVQNLIKIHPVKVDLEQFAYDTISQYRKIHGYHEIDIFTNFKTKALEIEIDQTSIQNTIITCLDYGIAHSRGNKISILFQDSVLEYNVDQDDNSLKIKRDALEILIVIDNATLTKQEIKKILTPTLDTIAEVNFAEIYKVITAHYGTFNVTLGDPKQLTYSITLPTKLKDIRPKKKNLPDKHLEEIKMVDLLITDSNYKIISNIALELLKEGVDFNTIIKITKLTPNELKQLNNL